MRVIPLEHLHSPGDLESESHPKSLEHSHNPFEFNFYLNRLGSQLKQVPFMLHSMQPEVILLHFRQEFYKGLNVKPSKHYYMLFSFAVLQPDILSGHDVQRLVDLFRKYSS